jgi:hypothetical protein
MKMPKLPKKTRPGMVVGVAWYREADWPRVKELFPDADELHDSYAEWLQSAEDAIKQIKRTGVAAEPFVVDIGDFLGWCLVHGRKRDAEARSEYVAQKLRLKHRGPGT